MNVCNLDIGIWMCAVNDISIEMLKCHDLQIWCVEQILYNYFLIGTYDVNISHFYKFTVGGNRR